MATKKPLKAKPKKAAPKKQDETEAQREHAHWADEIKRAKKYFEAWQKRAKTIVKLYKDERSESGSEGGNDSLEKKSRMNILWSNIQVLQPSLYSRTPEPNVSRRFMDKDPVSRTAALIIERNLQTSQELIEFDYPMKRVRDDYLLAARGTAWVRFAPEFGMLPMKEPVTKIYDDADEATETFEDDGGEGEQGGEGNSLYKDSKGNVIDKAKIKTDEEIGEYYETEPVEQVLTYGLDVDHILWSDFLHEPAKSWKYVGWVGIREVMKRAQLKKEFGDEIGSRITLNRTFERDEDGVASENPNAVEVWQIWCRTTKCVYWWSDAWPQALLKKQEDPLRLSGFFPCPRPIWGTMSTDSTIPVPDYCLYQDQANQIDQLTDRIRLLTKAIRVVGIYNAANDSLQQLLEEGKENDMIPVDNWVWFSGSNGIKGNVDWLPIEQMSNVLKTLFETRNQLRQDLYEVTGISDIIRGSTQASETATAQQIKANFGNLRLQDKQTEMSRFARDTLRIMAEIQCEHYPPEALIEMSGVLEADEYKSIATPKDLEDAATKVAAAIEMIKMDKLRTFKIDIETDATVAADQDKEKQARVEFLQAVSPFLEKAVQVGQASPEMIPLLLKMLDFGVRGFRTGRTLEGAIEQFIDTAEKAQQEAEKNPQPDQPTPEQIKAEGDVKNAADKLQGEMKRHQDELMAKQASEQGAAKLKADELEQRREEALARVKLETDKFHEELELRRQELENQSQKTQADIRLIEAQIAKLEVETATAGIKDIMGEVPEEVPGPTPVDEADSKAKMATAQTAYMEAQIKAVELQERLEELNKLRMGASGEEVGEESEADPETQEHEVIRDEAGNLLGMKSSKVVKPKRVEPIALPHDLGTPNFGKPKPPKRVMKLHQVIRDNDGNIMGLKTDEVEVDHDGPAGVGEPMHVGPPKPPAEAAPGVQSNGLPVPPSEMAPVMPKPEGTV